MTTEISMPLASAQGDDVEEEADYEADMDGGLFKLMPALGVDMPIGTNVWRLSSSGWCWTPEEGPGSSAGQPSLASRSGRSGPSPRKALAPGAGQPSPAEAGAADRARERHSAQGMACDLVGHALREWCANNDLKYN